MFKTKIAALLTACLLIAAAFAEEVAQIPGDISKFSVLPYSQNAIGKDLPAPETATIVKEKKSGKKTTIVLSCSHDYFWKGKAETCKYELIIFNIEDYQKKKEVTKGDVLGKIASDTVLLGRCKTPDPYLVISSSQPASLYKKNYYFMPGWLTRTTDTLFYRQVESFEDCVKDYYARWQSELEEGEENKVRYNSLFNYPELDSISFKTKLNELPGTLNSYGSIGVTSASYFGQNIWETFTLVDSECEYTPVLCWQYNFKSYLESEYQLGSDIYIYGTFLALDHIEKRIIFNVRDFLVYSEEEEYEKRVNDIQEIK